AGRAAFVGAGQVQGVAEHVQQRFFRLAEELDRVAVDRRFDMMFGHQFVLARSSAIMAARRVNTPATSMRNSTVPRLSSIGRHAARAAASSLSCAGRSSRLPMMACAASGTSSTRAATAPRDTRAAVTVPAPSTVKLTPAPTTAMSISVRGMKRRYASLERAERGGSKKDTTISPFRRASLRGPSMTSSTGRSRIPCGPASVARAPAAMRAGTLSAAGEPLHRLPPRVARPWIWVEPTRFAASTTPGHTCRSRGCSLSSAPVPAAPMRQPPLSSVIARVSGMRLMSTIRSGSTMSARIWTRRSVPPASTRASPVAPASSATAPLNESGASYRMVSSSASSVMSGEVCGVEAVHPRGVAAHDLGPLVGGHSGEDLRDDLPRARERGLAVGIVGAPHHVVDPDHVAQPNAESVLLEADHDVPVEEVARAQPVLEAVDRLLVTL